MFNVGDRLKINEELCPVGKHSEREYQFGKLNYATLMLEWEFEIVRIFEDDHHGEMAECSIINFTSFSNVVVRLDEMVFAQKVVLKIEYDVINRLNKFHAEIDALKLEEEKLIAFRSKLKKQGTPVTDKVLTDNWLEVKARRSKIIKLNAVPEEIFKVKHRSGVYDLECRVSDLPRKLRQAIRLKRTEVKKIVPVIKTIIGGMTLEKVGNVLTKSGRFLELNEKFAIAIIKQHKTPTTSDNYVGIEIEMLAPKSIELMNKAFIEARLHKYVNIGTDSSISNEVSGFTAMELRVCLPEHLLTSKLKEICEILRKNDCYANRSCGMHVHVDMRQRDPELCYRNFFKVQEIMVSAQPASRRKNKYCLPNVAPALKLKDFDNDNDAGRRRAINTASYNKNNMRTIEIRIHEGATKFKDIINWVNFLVETASLKTELEKPINNTKELKLAGYLSDKTFNHLEERIQEYSA